MRNKLSIITPHCVISLSSCKKIESLKKKTPLSSEGTLAIPAGFTWQNSRNINLTVSVTDTRYGSSMHMTSIYDRDPATGGKLILKGSATNKRLLTAKSIYQNRFHRYIL